MDEFESLTKARTEIRLTEAERAMLRAKLLLHMRATPLKPSPFLSLFTLPVFGVSVLALLLVMVLGTRISGELPLVEPAGAPSDQSGPHGGAEPMLFKAEMAPPEPQNSLRTLMAPPAFLDTATTAEASTTPESTAPNASSTVPY